MSKMELNMKSIVNQTKK